MNEFTRGDTFAFCFPITFKDGKAVTKGDLESLFVTCRKQPKEDSPIIFQKTLENVTIDSKGLCHVIFEPQDTESLYCNATYYYDIEITTINGYRKTLFKSFKLTQETTIHGGEENGS